MNIYSNVTEQDLINLSKLAEQQKNQRAEKIKKRILKKSHDIQLAENLSPITKKLDDVNETTEKLGETVEKSYVEYGNSQTPAVENITGTQTLRDTLLFMKFITKLEILLYLHLRVKRNLMKKYLMIQIYQAKELKKLSYL